MAVPAMVAALIIVLCNVLGPRPPSKKDTTVNGEVLARII